MRSFAGDAIAAEPRIYAYAESPMLLPLAPARGASGEDLSRPASRWRPSRPPILQYGSGEPIPARLVFLEAQPANNPGATWLPAPAVWSATGWEGTALPTWSPAGGFWALLVPPSADGARQVLRMNGTALPIVWLAPPPNSTDAARAPQLDFDRSALRELGGLIEGAASDPLQAWRIRLLTDRLRASELWPVAPPAPSDPALAALADQLEARWRSAVGALERDDADLASEFVARLTAVVRTPDGMALPAWAPDDSALTAVRGALLAPLATSASRVEAVRSWLIATPEALAWIVDDSAWSAGSDGRLSRRVTVAIANLTRTPVVASCAPVGRPALNAARIPAHGVAEFSCTLEAQDAPAAPGVIARAGGWSATLAFHGMPLRAAPPGFVIGPLLPRWDLPSLRAGVARSPDRRAAAVAMLQRAPTDAETWEVYVECSGADDGDVVSVWFGPFGAASSVVRVGPGASEGNRFHRQGARWWAAITVPAGAVDPESLLAIGVMRQSATGAVWSWPRPMALAQREPARAVVNLSNWGSLIESREPARGSGTR